MPLIHERFQSIRAQSGDDAVAALGSATNTNEALFLMKKYVKGRMDFRIGREVELYEQRQDDLLRRLDKHSNTHGALDLGLNGALNGLTGMRHLAEQKQLRAMWISFHPQLVGDDTLEIVSEFKRLIDALEFSVVSTTHRFDWAAKASVQMPMAAWAEEQGTFTNYAGRVQISNRAVMPPGDAQPLHILMAELLELSGLQVPREPAAIFERMRLEIPLYSGIDYDSIGPLGVAPLQTPQEVLR